MRFKKEFHDGVEYRFDPLSNHQSRINPARAGRIMQSAFSGDPSREWITSTGPACPFCPGKIGEATPCFPPELCSEGRMQSGDACIFPNLNPFSRYHAVATLSPEHFLAIDQFEETLLINNLTMSRDYFLTVFRHDSGARYPVYLWNYLPPSAGSIIHPHVQLMVEHVPLPELRRIISKSSTYFRRRGTNYWDALLKAEKSCGERYIGEMRGISIIASYAPRGFREVTLVVNGVSSFAGLSDVQIAPLARCLSTVLKGYKSMGVGSFNVVSYSSAMDDELPYFTLHFKVISRPYPRGIYTNDSGPFERFYDVWVIDTLPELVAQTLKNFFDRYL